MLALAMGKSGQNARLAARLTGWHIDIKSESTRKEAGQERVAHSAEELSKLEGVGPKTTDILIKGGWGSLEKLARAKPDDLTVLRGVGEKTAEKIIEAAKDVLANAEKDIPIAEEPVAEASATPKSAEEPKTE